MALKNILAILTVVVTLVTTCQVQGQIDLPGPRFRHRDVESPENTRPFAEPGVFNYDAQAFAPVDFTSSDELDANCGFFFTIDRVMTNVTRPGGDNLQPNNQRQNGSNNLWGNRYQGGWMSEDDTGWLIGYQNSSGIDFVNGQDILIANPMLVETSLSSLELNRLFRQETENGGYIEPYLGVRYFNVSDETTEDTARPEIAVNAFNRFKQKASNSAFGLHAGGRYSQRRGRFRYSMDGAVATLYNQQRLFATDILTIGAAVGPSEIYFNDQSFIPVLDLEFDLAYNISRDIAVRGGIQVQYLWDGLARANTLSTNFNPNSAFGGTSDPAGFHEDGMMSAGFKLGVEWRR